MLKSALLTVGSTEFPALVSAFLSRRVISKLASSLNTHSIYAQIGHSSLPSGFALGVQTVEGVEVHVARFTDDLERRVGESDLVVSHAGAGSILSFLRPLPSRPSPASTSKRRQLILVPNDTLMDSHQADLADEMETKGWATVCRDSSRLSETIDELARRENSESSRVEQNFPAIDEGKVQRILDETLGYA
ncbi:hypothetical protein JCM11491_006221 [Sporobolomyces phaffii]